MSKKDDIASTEYELWTRRQYLAATGTGAGMSVMPASHAGGDDGGFLSGLLSRDPDLVVLHEGEVVSEDPKELNFQGTAIKEVTVPNDYDDVVRITLEGGSGSRLWTENEDGSVSPTDGQPVHAEEVNSVRFASEFSGADGGAKIQAALDDAEAAHGRAAVIVTPGGPDTNGRWDVSSEIRPPSNTALIGLGKPLLYLTAGADCDAIQTKLDDTGDPIEDLTIEGFRIDGNKANQSDYSTQSDEPYNADVGKKLRFTAGVRIIEGHDVTVRDVTVNNYAGYGFETKVSEHVRIENCVSTNNDYDDGFSVSDHGYGAALTEDVTIVDCLSTDHPESGYEVDDGPRDVTIECCRSERCFRGYSIHEHMNEVAPEGIAVRECIAVDTTVRASSPPPDDGAAFNFGKFSGSGTPKNYKFIDCVADNPGGDAGFVYYDTGTAPQDVTIDGFELVNNDTNTAAIRMGHGVDGLTIRGVRARDAYLGIYLNPDTDAGFSDVEISGAKIHGCQNSGIALRPSGFDVTNVTITGCILKNNGQSAGGDPNSAGISLDASGTGSVTDVVITGCRLYDDGTGTQTHGVYHDSADYNVYDSNNLRGNGTAAFGGTAGTNSVKGDNIV